MQMNTIGDVLGDFLGDIGNQAIVSICYRKVL
jgi:hypothetical protein